MYVGIMHFGNGSKYIEPLDTGTMSNATKIFDAHIESHFSLGEIKVRGGEVRREVYRCKDTD